LKAETSIIATANPEDHSYDGSEPIESLALPQHVIDRFDVMVRVDDEIKDRDKEREMLKKQAKLDKGNYEVPFDRQTLKEYLAYAKEFEPEMSEDANEQIVEHILDLRMDYKESSLTALEISARDQEKLTRLSSAMAKLRLSETVEVEDVDRAWNLMLEGYQSMTFDALNLAKSKIPVNQGDDE